MPTAILIGFEYKNDMLPGTLIDLYHCYKWCESFGCNINVLTDIKEVDTKLLYTAIDKLIIESLNDYGKIDVDAIHESFTIVLNHVKSAKVMREENAEMINEEVIEIAVNKFNEKYESLNEDDKNLLQKLIKSTDGEKEELLESYKTESLVILERMNKESVKDSVTKAIQKIKEMVYNREKVDDDIISLYELKKELL